MISTTTLSRVLDVIATIAMIVLAGAMLWDRFPRKDTRPPPRSEMGRVVSVADAAFHGSDAAPVGILMYSDFECPYCGQFARETLPTLKRQYVDTGTVRLAFRHFPIPGHRFAERAAESVECAGRQRQFWRMHDLLFADQRNLNDDALIQRARQLELDMPSFLGCLEGTVAPRVRSDVAGAREAGVSGTPTFLLGTMRPAGQLVVAAKLTGAAPISEFTKSIDGVLAAFRREQGK